MTTDHKKWWIIGGAIVLGALIMATAMSDRGYRYPAYGPKDDGQPVAGSTSGKQALTYTQAVVKYEEAGKRIQFDDRCAATPDSVTYKNGTVVMLDNRSESARTISFDSRQYTVPGLGYTMVTVSSAKLPYTYLVDCDDQQNVLKVLVQK